MIEYKYRQFYKCGHIGYSDFPIKAEYCYVCGQPVETRAMVILYRKIKYFISDLIFNYKIYRVDHAIHLNWIVVGAIGNIILCILNLINLWRHW